MGLVPTAAGIGLGIGHRLRFRCGLVLDSGVGGEVAVDAPGEDIADGAGGTQLTGRRDAGEGVGGGVVCVLGAAERGDQRWPGGFCLRPLSELVAEDGDGERGQAFVCLWAGLIRLAGVHLRGSRRGCAGLNGGSRGRGTDRWRFRAGVEERVDAPGEALSHALGRGGQGASRRSRKSAATEGGSPPPAELAGCAPARAAHHDRLREVRLTRSRCARWQMGARRFAGNCRNPSLT